MKKWSKKSCRSWWAVQLSYSWVFHLKSFGLQNLVWSSYFLKFKFWIVQTKSHEKFSKIKVVDLVEIYNFYVHKFFIWHHLVFENLVWISHFLKFKFWIVQTKSREKFYKIKVVDLDELYNFYVYNISILNYLLYQNSIRRFEIEIINLTTTDACCENTSAVINYYRRVS